MRVIALNKQHVGDVVLKNSLYQIELPDTLELPDVDHLFPANIDFDDPVWKWHRRLGHLNAKTKEIFNWNKNHMEIK